MIQDDWYKDSPTLTIDDSCYNSNTIDFMDYLSVTGYRPVKQRLDEEDHEYGYVMYKEGQLLFEVWTTSVVKVSDGTSVVGYFSIPEGDEEVCSTESALRKLTDEERVDDHYPTHEISILLKVLI